MKLGRNDPCHCGSGKKYKHCHYDADRKAEAERLAAERQAAAESASSAETAPTEGGEESEESRRAREAGRAGNPVHQGHDGSQFMRNSVKGGRNRGGGRPSSGTGGGRMNRGSQRGG